MRRLLISLFALFVLTTGAQARTYHNRYYGYTHYSHNRHHRYHHHRCHRVKGFCVKRL